MSRVRQRPSALVVLLVLLASIAGAPPPAAAEAASAAEHPTPAPGKRLSAAELKPAPAFDARTEVPGRSGSMLGSNPAIVYRSFPEMLPSRRIAAGPQASVLHSPRAPFDVRYTYDGHEHTVGEFAERTGTTGLLILKGDQILFEGYYQGADPQDTFISFSTGKSFVSTLLAFAVGDGKIASVSDPIIKYLPELEGSAYATARIKDVLQMSSGTSYSEEYEDADSDIARYVSLVSRNEGGIYDFARSFKSARPPGQKFYYASMDTEVLGALIARVTGQSLSAYMSEKLWKPIGAEAAARWVIDQPGAAGREMAAGGLQIRLRDYGRFGLLFANGGNWHGKQLLPAGWVEEATRPSAPHVDYGQLDPDYTLGYGYQWWCLPGPHRRFTAQGIHGQFVMVDPVQKLVVVKLSSWAHAWEAPKESETYAFFDAVANAVK